MVIDETLRELPWPARRCRPFAAVAESDDLITLGSTGKSFWGGLRVGWIRTAPDVIDRLAAIRPSIDLGSSVLDQLVVEPAAA